jgi:hypothetical protein
LTKRRKLLEDKKEVQMITFAGKKGSLPLFYTQREIILFNDGCFAYKRKQKSPKIKKMISPSNMVKVTRGKNILTIQTNFENEENLY